MNICTKCKVNIETKNKVYVFEKDKLYFSCFFCEEYNKIIKSKIILKNLKLNKIRKCGFNKEKDMLSEKEIIKIFGNEKNFLIDFIECNNHRRHNDTKRTIGHDFFSIIYKHFVYK